MASISDATTKDKLSQGGRFAFSGFGGSVVLAAIES